MDENGIFGPYRERHERPKIAGDLNRNLSIERINTASPEKKEWTLMTELTKPSPGLSLATKRTDTWKEIALHFSDFVKHPKSEPNLDPTKVLKALRDFNNTAVFMLFENLFNFQVRGGLIEKTETKIPVAFMVIEKPDSLDYAPKLLFFAVHPLLRKKKYGKYMYMFYEAFVYVEFPNVSFIVLQVVNTQGARSFYEKMGYKYISLREVREPFFADGSKESEVRMIKIIWQAAQPI